MDPKEIIRQSAIHEIITGEEEYIEDLDTYENVSPSCISLFNSHPRLISFNLSPQSQLFITPLQDQSPPAIFQPGQLHKFSSQVFSCILDIRDYNRRFLNQLKTRQAKQHPLIIGIGDIILSSALEWGDLYIAYATDHPLGELEIEKQTSQNALFAELVQVSSANLALKLLSLPGTRSGQNLISQT